jgi:hypothetical protein
MPEPENPPRSLISRSAAAIVLIVLVAAGALSAWMLLRADFDHARRDPATLPITTSPDDAPH